MIKLENKLPSLTQALKIKLSEELQDYKVKSVLETERLQDSVWREGLQDYKILSKGKDYKSLFGGRESYLGPKLWTSKFELENWNLELEPQFFEPIFVFGVRPFIDEMNHGKSSKVTWVSKVNSSWSVGGNL